ncbi:MAG: class I SAM-dependent methyltransferase [Lachnospiraceae bacterium]|nr:class I SAM-dependent methyltransferase [Lachnospiraceae bacterium]
MQYEKIYQRTEAYFNEKIEKFGSNSIGVGWNGNDAQRIRYDQLAKLLSADGENFSVCDYGCGYGYFYSYLKEKFPDWKGIYAGLDVSDKMIEEAKRKFGQNEAKRIFINDSKLNDTYDYIVSSGIFNLKLETSEEEWKKYILETINRFHSHSEKGFAFNALTKYSDKDKMREDLYYSDPLFLFDYCKTNFSKNVALLHDYQLYDFTIIVRKF